MILGVKINASLIIFAFGERKRVYKAARWYFSPFASFAPSSLISFVINPWSSLTRYGSTCVHRVLAKWIKLDQWVLLSWPCWWGRGWKKDVGSFWRAKNSYNLIRVKQYNQMMNTRGAWLSGRESNPTPAPANDPRSHRLPRRFFTALQDS